MPYSETDSLYRVKGDAKSQKQKIDWIHRHCFDASDIFCRDLNKMMEPELFSRITLDTCPG